MILLEQSKVRPPCRLFLCTYQVWKQQAQFVQGRSGGAREGQAHVPVAKVG